MIRMTARKQLTHAAAFLALLTTTRGRRLVFDRRMLLSVLAAAVVGAGVTAAALSLFAVAGPAHAQAGADKTIDEIVVTTARRREESLMEVPLSISVPIGDIEVNYAGSFEGDEMTGAVQSPRGTVPFTARRGPE